MPFTFTYGTGTNEIRIPEYNAKVNRDLPLDGPTLALSYEELAEIALSGIAPLCIPRLLRQLAVTTHEQSHQLGDAENAGL